MASTRGIAMTQGGWTRLPDPILMMVFHYIKGSDRFTASTVCKKWGRVFLEPCLWRSVSFNIKASIKPDSEFLEALRKFIQIVRGTTQEIIIHFDHQDVTFGRQHAIYLQTILTEFSYLGNNSKVQTLNVKNLLLEKAWEQFDISKCLLMASIARFVGHQRQLKRLTLSSSLTRAEMGCMILQSLVRSPFTKTLQYLDLCGFMIDDYMMLESIYTMENMFKNCRRLKELRLNYSYLEAIRDNVCDLLRETLELLVLYASINVDKYYITNRGRFITTDCWRIAFSKYPSLKLEFHICDQSFDPTRLLVAHMPLVRFSYTYRWDVNPNDDLETKVNAVLARLAELSLPALEEASFWVNGQESVLVLPKKEHIAQILATSTNLRRLSFSRQLMTAEYKDVIQSEIAGLRRDDVIAIV